MGATVMFLMEALRLAKADEDVLEAVIETTCSSSKLVGLEIGKNVLHENRATEMCKNDHQEEDKKLARQKEREKAIKRLEEVEKKKEAEKKAAKKKAETDKQKQSEAEKEKRILLQFLKDHF